MNALLLGPILEDVIIISDLTELHAAAYVGLLNEIAMIYILKLSEEP